jgi:hypothetical protein
MHGNKAVLGFCSGYSSTVLSPFGPSPHRAFYLGCLWCHRPFVVTLRSTGSCTTEPLRGQPRTEPSVVIPHFLPASPYGTGIALMSCEVSTSAPVPARALNG